MVQHFNNRIYLSLFFSINHISCFALLNSIYIVHIPIQCGWLVDREQQQQQSKIESIESHTYGNRPTHTCTYNKHRSPHIPIM